MQVNFFQLHSTASHHAVSYGTYCEEIPVRLLFNFIIVSRLLSSKQSCREKFALTQMTLKMKEELSKGYFRALLPSSNTDRQLAMMVL